MNRSLGLVLCLLLSVAVIALAGGEKETGGEAVSIVAKVAHVNPPGDPSYEAWEFFKKKIEETTSGKIKVDLFPAGQLSGDERELIEQVKIGSIDMTSANVAPVALEYPKFEIFNLPYMFRNEQGMFNFMDGPAGQKMAKEFEQTTGIVLLAYWHNGVRNTFQRTQPLSSPADFQGKKIRVMNNDVYISFFRALGANPVPMAYGEVYSALQTGVVDAADNDTSGYRAMKFFEPAPYYSLTGHVMSPKIVMGNTSFLAKIPSDLKPAFDAAVRQTMEYQRDLYVKARASDIEWMKANGIEVNEVQDLSAFQEIARKAVWSKYEEKIGKDLIEAAMNTQ